MSQSIKNMLVGVFILGAISVIVSVIMFLKPTIGDGKQVLEVRFSDINKLHVGTRVLFGGRPIGEVVSMKEIKDAREQPTDELGRVYFYQLTLHVDSGVKVYNTDEVSIQTAGLMGERSVSITPKAPPKGVTPKQITSQPIYANSVDPLQNAMIDFSDLSAMMEDTFKELKNWMNKYGDETGMAVGALGAALSDVHFAMEQMDEANTFKNMGAITENLKQATANLADGKGTLGKLLDNNDLYLQLNGIMSKANNLMNDVNHYGILFHLNKQWQRTRLQKINELNALSTPQNFRKYFQTEVDDINASMTRISMLIQKAENSPQKQAILNSPQFKNDFAELLRRADELSDNLKLYNQQLLEADGR